MSTVELGHLESQIDSLLSSLERLKSENISLHQLTSRVKKDNAGFQDRDQQLAKKIRSVVTKLREEMS